MVNLAKLRGRLRELGLTQSGLADHLGIANATASQKLNGIRPITLDEAEKIAEFLSIPDVDFRAYFFAPPSA